VCARTAFCRRLHSPTSSPCLSSACKRAADMSSGEHANTRSKLAHTVGPGPWACQRATQGTGRGLDRFRRNSRATACRDRRRRTLPGTCSIFASALLAPRLRGRGYSILTSWAINL
jgi:hypothetical protein